MLFPRAKRGFDVCGFVAARKAIAGRWPARRVREDRETRVLAAAQDDVETVETGLGGGQTGGRLCRIRNLAAGTRREIELGTIRATDKTFELNYVSDFTLAI